MRAKRKKQVFRPPDAKKDQAVLVKAEKKVLKDTLDDGLDRLAGLANVLKDVKKK
jgi:hypothetical protein